MAYHPDIHHRRSIRLKGYDYSKEGAYFVTICTHERECLFGAIVDGVMRLNDAGRMITKWYEELENKFKDIKCDAFVSMPNHVHFIVINVGADLCVRPIIDAGGNGMGGRLGEHVGQGEHIGSPLRAVVQWFKTMTTNGYIKGVKEWGWLPFHGKMWQRNYYERVIRSDDELSAIREYITHNPQQWATDSDNPNNALVRGHQTMGNQLGQVNHGTQGNH